MIDEMSFSDKQIDSYRIIKQLPNPGGFGRVYLGEHVVFKERPIVAIKVLHAHLASNTEVERFIQEAHFLEKLQHDHILPIINAGIKDGLPYLVVKYAEKGSLRDHLLLHAPKTLPIDEAMVVIAQIGQALQYAHQEDIVHRDLKPENILFDSKGKVLLADFGIAVVAERTKTIDDLGSPPYMAPEQFDGKVSKKSDQYALGCIAYELITGRRPFILPRGASSMAWAVKHATENPIPPTKLNPNIYNGTGFLDSGIR